jgi:MFS family permease
MLRPATDVSFPRVAARPSRTRRLSAQPTSAYGRPFWFTYLANSSMMVAVSLLFRYADFVKQLGGTELNLGWIVGIGMVGSLAMRLLQGVGIDTYGPRKIWLLSSALFIVSCLGHLFVTSPDGPAIFLLRIAYQCAIAGFFGASITFISGRAPVARIAEVVGTLGTSGFLGMVAGTTLGDHLLGYPTVTPGEVRAMFTIAAALGACGFVFSWLATPKQAVRTRRKQVSVFRLLGRYHPGAVLVIAAATGFGLQLPGTFLRPYADALGLAGIAVFFSVHAPLAFATRLFSRRLPERHGLRAVLLIGMASLVVGMLLFTIVRSPWMLAIPAVFTGIAHALLFPSVVAGGTATFPLRYRGLATVAVLAVIDMGTLVGSPVVGGIVHYSADLGLRPYPTMFVAVATSLAMAGAAFAWATRARGNRVGASAAACSQSVRIEAGKDSV